MKICTKCEKPITKKNQRLHKIKDSNPVAHRVGSVCKDCINASRRSLRGLPKAERLKFCTNESCGVKLVKGVNTVPIKRTNKLRGTYWSIRGVCKKCKLANDNASRLAKLIREDPDYEKRHAEKLAKTARLKQEKIDRLARGVIMRAKAAENKIARKKEAIARKNERRKAAVASVEKAKAVKDRVSNRIGPSRKYEIERIKEIKESNSANKLVTASQSKQILMRERIALRNNKQQKVSDEDLIAKFLETNKVTVVGGSNDCTPRAFEGKLEPTHFTNNGEGGFIPTGRIT